MERLVTNLPITDAHVHFWNLKLLDYPWLNAEPKIKKTFLIEDYQQETAAFEIEKIVFVQAECRPDQYLKELELVEAAAQQDPRIQAIVAYAPLEKGGDVLAILERYQAHEMVKGVRRMYDDTPSICSHSAFVQAVRALPKFGLSFDLSIVPQSMSYTLELIRACPDTFFILDHLGKPAIKEQRFAEYQKSLKELAALPNVVAKLSGLLTLAGPEISAKSAIYPYIDCALEQFGCDRLMFGSDWPVVNLGGNFHQWVDTVLKVVGECSDEELHKLFHKTANATYRI